MKISIDKSRIFKVAHQLFKAGIKTFSEALTIAWAKYKANFAKTVTFIKKSGEETTRNIAALSTIGYTPKGGTKTVKQSATIKMIDTDKLAKDLNPYACIISFNRSQLVGFTF